MKANYYYVACDAGGSVNQTHRHYFRLYKDGVKPILVEQGLADLIEGWVEKYDATLNTTNPYPNLD